MFRHVFCLRVVAGFEPRYSAATYIFLTGAAILNYKVKKKKKKLFANASSCARTFSRFVPHPPNSSRLALSLFLACDTG